NVAVFQTSGGDVSYGTYLAVNGGTFQFSNLKLTGALINTAGNVQFVSGSQIGAFVPFEVPEPATFSLLGIGLVAFGIFRKRRLRAA
ncbi:MAG TPA: PEP-CTERM sorting domain-containing protein, partial [Chthoniobacterales bacterium]|nr:PEP-CTERM sorting domain-containing protein [Chthoniobacterales bacterium]